MRDRERRIAEAWASIDDYADRDDDFRARTCPATNARWRTTHCSSTPTTGNADAGWYGNAGTSALTPAG
ncbi:hypothetical protein ABNF97_16500 [Plantactinospora sp. B6F1]|uniref:hypothetical protein n=1 Tax=Plantactinospora sp. B6F1 TaxID=3158971 RepID=UPI0032D95622